MRESLQSLANPRYLMAVLAAFAVASLGAACQRFQSPPDTTVSADTWAVVDGRPITRDDVERAFRRAQADAETLSEEEALTAKLNVLNELIVESVLLAKAAELKIEVPQTELDSAFAEAKKGIPDDAFSKEITRRNLTETDMREGLRRELLAQKTIEREVTSKVAITDLEVSDFFTANRAQFNLPEDAYHLAQIIVTGVREAQLANRTGDDATTPQTAAAKTAMLMARLKEGVSFGDLARDYSEDPESAPRGGDLGLIPLSTLKQAPPALRDVVLSVTPGSARVVTQGGVHTIVYVVAKETAGQRELTTPGVRERITETLKARRQQLLQTAYLTTARSEAVVTNYLARRVVDSQGKP